MEDPCLLDNHILELMGGLEGSTLMACLPDLLWALRYPSS